jgi:hypothetical protein
VKQTKQSRSRGTTRRYVLEHKNNTTEKTESVCSDEEHNTGSDRDSDDSDSDIDPDIEQEPSEDHGKPTWFISFVEHVLLYTTCLTQLGNALECPAPQSKHNTDPRVSIVSTELNQVPADPSLTTGDNTAGESSNVPVDKTLLSDEETTTSELREEVLDAGLGTPTSEVGEEVIAAYLGTGKTQIPTSEGVETDDASTDSSPMSITSSVDPEVLYCSAPGCEQNFHGKHRKGSLNRHMRRKHRGSPADHPCAEPSCSRTFNRSDSRLKHYRKHHPWLANRRDVPRGPSNLHGVAL